MHTEFGIYNDDLIPHGINPMRLGRGGIRKFAFYSPGITLANRRSDASRPHKWFLRNMMVMFLQLTLLHVYAM